MAAMFFCCSGLKSQTERETAGRQLEAEKEQLARERVSIAALREDTRTAADRWRQTAQAAERLERLLQQRRPAIAA